MGEELSLCRVDFEGPLDPLIPFVLDEELGNGPLLLLSVGSGTRGGGGGGGVVVVVVEEAREGK